MKESSIILYLHIPKTGGTTLNQHLYRYLCAKTHEVAEEGYFHAGVYYYPNGFFAGSEPNISPNIRHALARHDLRAVLGHFSFGLHRYVSRPWTYITLLRDPVDRIISLYSHLNIADNMSIEAFISDPPYREVDNDQTRRLSGIDAAIGKCSQKMLVIARENLCKHFSVVGTTERFDEALILLKQRFGWKKAPYFYLKNVNRDRPPKEAFAQRTLDAIRSRNALDLELYDTAQTLLNEALSTQDSSFGEQLACYRSLKTAEKRRKRTG